MLGLPAEIQHTSPKLCFSVFYVQTALLSSHHSPAMLFVIRFCDRPTILSQLPPFILL